MIKLQEFLVIFNKIDLTNEKPRIIVEEGMVVIYLSLKNLAGFELLKKHLKDITGFETYQEGTFNARRRHLEALKNSAEFLYKAQQEFFNSNPFLELIAENLRQAQHAFSGKF